MNPPLTCRLPVDVRWVCRSKAMLDYLLAAVLLIPAVPMVFMAWCLVRITSRGPGFYSQERVGQFGHVFTIIKLRTMYHECESITGPRWSTPDDPRVTRIGKVLRSLHIDELPQLWNVLAGQMSLIGPRPERPEIAAKLRQSIPSYDVRMVLKPGVSGLAQIHLPPDTNLASVRRKLLLDIHYIQNVSVWMDVKIIACTALKVIGLHHMRGTNALPTPVIIPDDPME